MAKKAGTQKSNISRLESGNYNPSLDLLIKVARCLGKELKIQMQ
ncbi:MAG: helix-turn-helix transcriptional regulator [Lachnospiraceae bacterium]|nr:helix-turn-helix transcriptional regulator [Lachnospiraceae bacterium]